MLRRCVLAVALLGLAAPVAAQERALKILVGFPPGSSLDTMARLVGDHMRAGLGQTVVVENRPGVSGQLAADTLKVAPSDGATILITPLAPFVTHPHVYSKLRYDPFKDFTPLAHIANFEFALAVPAGLPARSLAEYVDLVKRDAKYANYSSAGAGAIPHFFGVAFAREAKIDTVHIPYKGTAQALPDLVSGQISAFVGVVADVAGLHKAGKVRVLASSGQVRHRAMPDVPTFRERGFDIEGFGWYGAYAPAGLSAASAERLGGAVVAAIRNPALAERLATLGMEPTGLPGADLATIHKADYERWGPVIRASGFKAE